MRKQNADLLQGRAFLEEELGRLSGAVKAAAREKEELGVSLLQVEQEKNHAIIELRQGAGQLRDQLSDHLDHLKRMELALNAKEKDYQALAERLLHEERLRAESEALQHGTARELADREAEAGALRAELSRLGESSSKEAKRMNELIRMLEGENGRLARERDELGGQDLEKQQEILALLERVQKLERQCEVAGKQVGQLSEENAALARNNDLLKEELEIAVLEQRNGGERCQLQANRIATLEQLLEKERRRAGQLEAGSERAAHCRQLSLEHGLGQRYEAELEAALREKGEIAGMFEAEKERLVRTYEQALREKELLFKDKIRFLESEVLELSKVA